jgi:two-component system, OmpR family, response regulator
MMTEQDAASGRPLILLIEDDPQARDMYGKILWYNGFDVSYAVDAGTGWELARQQRPALILLDLMLPDENGLTLCRRLRAHPPTRGTPVVALTGRPRRVHGASAAGAGCNQYLEKPVSPVDVLHAVEALVGRPPLPGAVATLPWRKAQRPPPQRAATPSPSPPRRSQAAAD